MSRSPDRGLTTWAVSDGRIGIENQVVGLAEAVARLRPADVIVKTVRWKPWLDRLPSALKLLPRAMLSSDGAPLGPPWPDLWIAAGRATLPLSVNVRRWSEGRTFVVQVQDPRWPLRFFDLVAPPAHDGLAGGNVVPIAGSPNRLTPERLVEARSQWAARLADLPHPRVAVLIGGKSGAFDLTPAPAAQLAERIAGAVEAGGGSVMVTFSRRTPAKAEAILRRRLSRLPGLIWDGAGQNPYFGFLASADHILVTEDSTNMATDAAATGTPVSILPVVGRSKKFARFHADLAARGISRPFDGTLTGEPYAPLDETARLAAEIVARMDARAADSA